MKKVLLFLLSLPLFIPIQKTFASHCAGGELLYQWVSDSTYKIIFKLYRDCAGNTAPGNVPMCYTSTCDGSSQSITLLPPATLPDGQANGSSVSSGCGGYPSKCESTSSTLPGYAEWWYTGTVTLPHPCSEWQFSVSISARNVSNNLSGGSNNDFYIQSTLNSIAAPHNSSPSFTVRPVPFVCINNPYTYNNGAQDADGDSLSYEILNPQKGSCGSTGTNILYSNTAYNTTTNPISTGNTFVLDPHTGQMSFTPNLTGAGTLTLRVKEYKNKVLVGSATRDIQVQVLTCNSVQPAIGADSLTLAGGQLVNGRIENCAGTTMSFCFKIKSPNTGAILVASDNHTAVAQGSVVTYSGQKTDSIYGCFSWTPAATDTGFRTFAVTVKDSTCLPPGVAVSQTFVIPIYIYSVTSIFRDTTVCAGESVRLIAVGGTVFNWSVLPGGAPLSTLSCTNCSSPIASPTVTTRYVVTSNLVSVCNINKDTVTITVTPLPSTPVLTSNSPVCVGESLQLFSNTTASAYSWTGPAGFNSVLGAPVLANAQLPNSGTYRLIATNGRCSSQPASMNVIVAATPRIPVITGDSMICEGQELTLKGTSNVNTIYRWTGPNGFTASTQTISLPNVQPALSGTYTVTAYNSGTLTCPSPAASYQVTVTPKITADFTISKTTICEEEDIIISSTTTGGGLLHYSWNFGNNSILKSGTAGGPYTVSYATEGTKYITMRADNEQCSDSISKEVQVMPTPSSSFHIQPYACTGEQVWLNSDESVAFGLSYNWNFNGAQVHDGNGKGPYNISFSTPGLKIISLSAQNAFCSSALTVDTVYVRPVPETKITSAKNQQVCAGDPVLFTATNVPGHTYQWLPEAWFTQRGASSEARVIGTGYIQLRVSDSLGCSGVDSIYMTTKPCCEVTMPNAFTPNNDGRNDLFRMVTAGNQITAEFRVLNRWGQTIFLSGDKGSGWDGTYNNKPVDAGTYFYYLKYKCMNDQYFEQKGEVTLIR